MMSNKIWDADPKYLAPLQCGKGNQTATPPTGGGGGPNHAESIEALDKRINLIEASLKSLPGYPGLAAVVGIVISAAIGCSAFFINAALNATASSLQRVDNKIENFDARIRALEQSVAVQLEISRRIELKVDQKP